jgi:hypothetical protein
LQLCTDLFNCGERDGITEKNPRWWNSFVKLKQDDQIG